MLSLECHQLERILGDLRRLCSLQPADVRINLDEPYRVVRVAIDHHIRPTDLELSALLERPLLAEVASELYEDSRLGSGLLVRPAAV
jgi:hypothetical protein